MATQASLGQKALEERKWDEAVKYFTDALKSSRSPLWLIQRSTAYNRLGSHEKALQDAEQAVVAATLRARRELMATAQFRRAVALYSLKRFADSRLCFIWCRKLNEKEKGLGIWQAKVSAEFDKLPEDSPLREPTVKETPEESAGEDSPKESVKGKEKATEKPIPGPLPTMPASTAQTPIDKIKHDWYQSSSSVSITIMAKGVPQDKTEVDIESRSIDVSFPHSSGSTYNFNLDPLFGEIDGSKSTYRITPHKIEITLHKATPGLKWAKLEGDAEHPSTTTTKSATTPIIAHEKVPSYPTSSKTGSKDWDKLASESLVKLREKEKKEKGKEKPKEGATAGGDSHPGHSHDDDDDDDDDEDGGDPANAFFKKLYAGADPDTRRAMMKSFTESNGTALSTNWADVASKTFETNPPSGVEEKKWGS